MASNDSWLEKKFRGQQQYRTPEKQKKKNERGSPSTIPNYMQSIVSTPDQTNTVSDSSENDNSQNAHNSSYGPNGNQMKKMLTI